LSPLIESMDNLVRDVPAMPAVAQRVMHLLGDPRSSNTDLSEALSADQALASRILQMANSPFFGTRQKISSIANAIFVMGHAALRSLIITVCTKGLYKNLGLMEQKLWEHSLGTAISSRYIAKKVGFFDAEEAFIGGLLHNIGRTILAVIYHKEMESLFVRFYNEGLMPSDMLAMEKEEFGYDSCEIGARVVTKWRLPGIYTRICRRHATEDPQLLLQEESPHAISIVGQANLITYRLGLGIREPDKRVDVIGTAFCDILKLEENALLDLIRDIVTNFRETQDHLGLK
jgi:HD-like signal output (HDOD) protein